MATTDVTSLKTGNDSVDDKIPKFEPGEKVLCFHGPLIYEAKCKKFVFKDNKMKYLIHYAGWNKNWDEWVPETRVLKFNEENISRQRQVDKDHKLKSSSVKNVGRNRSKVLGSKKGDSKELDSRASTPNQDAGSPAPGPSKDGSVSGLTTASNQEDEKRRKKMKNLNVESEEVFINKVEVKIKLPDELIPWLVDDWEWISNKRKLLQLPSELTVNQILNDYSAYKRAAKSHNESREMAVTDLTNGIKEYFNAVLNSLLLYSTERAQYDKIVKEHPDKEMSAIYGAEHLLRLFVRLGSLLAFTPLDKKDIQFVLAYLQDFFKYMVKNSSTLFNLSRYKVDAGPERLRRLTQDQ